MVTVGGVVTDLLSVSWFSSTVLAPLSLPIAGRRTHNFLPQGVLTNSPRPRGSCLTPSGRSYYRMPSRQALLSLPTPGYFSIRHAMNSLQNNKRSVQITAHWGT
ncbi:Uncharacterised protein [Chlamydia trachomatis]|nr:Uncharacterised protein [Chlamydia trachomatis]